MTLAEEKVTAAQAPGTGTGQTTVPVRSDSAAAHSGAERDCTAGRWNVDVAVTAHSVMRAVRRTPPSADSAAWKEDAKAIWPTWPASLAEERQASVSPLAELQTHWDDSITRLRDSAKWVATALGAALAAVIPAAPLSGLAHRHLSGAAALEGLAGLLLIGVTLVLVLRVLQPQSLSYADIQEAGKPLLGGGWTTRGAWYRWQRVVQEHADIYLPCGVPSLTTLRQLLVVEETTLMALADARESVRDDDQLSKVAQKAYTARVARLHELRAAAASIVAIGNFYVVRMRSNWSTYGGAFFGLAGLALILKAVIG